MPPGAGCHSGHCCPSIPGFPPLTPPPPPHSLGSAAVNAAGRCSGQEGAMPKTSKSAMAVSHATRTAAHSHVMAVRSGDFEACDVSSVTLAIPGWPLLTSPAVSDKHKQPDALASRPPRPRLTASEGMCPCAPPSPPAPLSQVIAASTAPAVAAAAWAPPPPRRTRASGSTAKSVGACTRCYLGTASEHACIHSVMLCSSCVLAFAVVQSCWSSFIHCIRSNITPRGGCNL